MRLMRVIGEGSNWLIAFLPHFWSLVGDGTRGHSLLVTRQKRKVLSWEKSVSLARGKDGIGCGGQTLPVGSLAGKCKARVGRTALSSFWLLRSRFAAGRPWPGEKLSWLEDRSAVTSSSRGTRTLLRRMALQTGEGPLGAASGGPGRGWRGFPDKTDPQAGGCCLPSCAGLQKRPFTFLTKTLLQNFPTDGAAGSRTPLLFSNNLGVSTPCLNQLRYPAWT